MATIETKIISAVVYPDQAHLTRQGTTLLETGRHALEIADLPTELLSESLRAAARGSAQARLLGVQSQTVYYTETPVEEIQKLETELESAQDEQRGLEAHSELVKQNRVSLAALLGHTDIYARGLARGMLSLEAQAALYEHLRSQVGSLDSQALSLAVSKRELDRKIERLQNQLKNLRNARRRQRITVSVEIEVLVAGELTIDLTYMVNNASWEPLYDIRLLEKEANPSLELTGLAEISQQTGESWQDVALALSTARPGLAEQAPELEPWYIQPYSAPIPRPPVMRAAPGTAMPAASIPPSPTMKMDEALSFSLAEPVTATVDNSGAAVTYHVPGTLTIPNDGQPHKVTVMILELSPRLDYVSAPRLVEAVYRRAKAPNDSPYLLLPGSANLFSGDEFIGSSELELTAPQQEIELFMGVDDRIKVGRKLVRRDVDKTLVGGKRRTRYGYEIKLENLLPRQAAFTLHDQIPVSRHEDIKIRLETVEPRPSKQTELNLLDWEFNLAPQEKRLVRFDFTVEYPQAMNVMGLP